ncbi:ferredoxin [Mycolicibacterium fluoranthenivorans]
MRASVDSNRCQGHTLCAMIAPAAFELDDLDGRAAPVSEVVSIEQQRLVREAARSCPERAIHLADDPDTAADAPHTPDGGDHGEH